MLLCSICFATPKKRVPIEIRNTIEIAYPDAKKLIWNSYIINDSVFYEAKFNDEFGIYHSLEFLENGKVISSETETSDSEIPLFIKNNLKTSFDSEDGDIKYESVSVRHDIYGNILYTIELKNKKWEAFFVLDKEGNMLDFERKRALPKVKVLFFTLFAWAVLSSF
jgi:hypothetical protein